MNPTTRRRFIQSGAAVSAVALAGCGQGDPDEETDAPTDDPTDEPTEEPEEQEEFDASYEIWAADQGTHTIYIYEDAEGDEFDLVDEIDTAEAGGEVPHMVDYSSDYEYAAVACTAGARTLIYRTEDRELVANLETGAGSHFAGFTPDDEFIHVDVIGEGKIVRIDADLENEEFDVVDEIEVLEDETVQDNGIESGAPICHQYDQEGRSVHTMGPSYHDGAVLIIEHDDFEVDEAFSHDDLPANCGTFPHPTEDKMYLTAGLPTPTDDDGEPIEGEEGVGDYYVLDTAEEEVATSGSTGGIDAHGFWLTPDGEELWVLNRETNDGIILDPDTDEQIGEIDAYGPAESDDPNDRDSPDIMWASPDGEYMFVTLRGANPVSGDPHAATGVNPGFAVFDIESRERVDVVQPDADNEDSDFHGIGVRPLAEFDGYTSPSY